MKVINVNNIEETSSIQEVSVVIRQKYFSSAVGSQALLPVSNCSNKAMSEHQHGKGNPCHLYFDSPVAVPEKAIKADQLVHHFDRS